MNNQILNKKIAEIKEEYKDRPNDKNYFLCRLAMTKWDNDELFHYIMSHVNQDEVSNEERKLILQNMYDEAANIMKEQSWIAKNE